MQASQRRPLTKIGSTLPADWYYDPAIYKRELEAIWYQDWIYVGRSKEVSERRDFMVASVGDQNVVITRDLKGQLRAFHNTCRHRGSILCTEEKGSFEGGTIVCPYHAWTYSLDGGLIATPHQLESADFDMGDYSLYDVAVGEWGGFVFVNMAGQDAEPLESALGDIPSRFKNYAPERLEVGLRVEYPMDANWKVFWENFSECFHCPGVHPELCEVVLTYGKGLLSEREDPSWQPGDDDDGTTRLRPTLGEGMVTWTMDGKTDIPFLPDLTEEEKATGHTFGVLRPSLFSAFHPDFIEVGTIVPRGPEEMTLVMEWLFEESTLARPDFEPREHVSLSLLVTEQDVLACEWNQAGLHSRRHDVGVLVPQEQGLGAFYDWVRERLGEA